MKRTAAVIGTSLVLAMLFGISAFAENENNILTTQRVLVAATVILFLLIAVAFHFIIRSKLDNGKNKNYDIGTKRAVRSFVEHLNPLERKNMWLAYIGFDELNTDEPSEANKLADLNKYMANVLKESTEASDCTGCTDDGRFLLAFKCTSPNNAVKKMTALTERVAKYEMRFFNESATHLHIGMVSMAFAGKNFDEQFKCSKTAFENAIANNIPVSVCSKELIANMDALERRREALDFAVNDNQFEIYLQFIYNIKQGGFTCAEVLSRWNDPQEGILLPGHYIGDMCKTGVIVKFDYYIIEKTCALLADWSKNGYGALNLSCNVTRLTVSQKGFADKIREILQKYEFDRSKLLFEITEDALFDSRATTRNNIETCKALGIRFAIDDFGSGNTSITDLCDLPVDVVKLDRAVVKNSTTKRGAELLCKFVNFAHGLNITVVCEGVETAEQKDAVLNSGCDFIQGYFYSYVFSVTEGVEYYNNFSEAK